MRSRLNQIMQFFSLFAKGVIFLSVFLLGFLIWKSEFVNQGTLRSLYFRYYVLYGFLIVSEFIFLKLKDSLKVAIVLIVGSSFLTLGFVEVVLHLLHSDPDTVVRNIMLDIDQKRLDVIKESGKPYDFRSKFDVLRDYKEEKKDIFPVVCPANFLSNSRFLASDGSEIYPLGGVSNQNTLFCNESGEYLEYISDKYGFNNLKDVWEKEIDIFLIGDSFVHGKCVTQEQNFSGQLRTLTNKNVVNTGCENNGPLLELATLKEYAEAKKPKKVVWFYYEGNDLGGLETEIQSSAILKYLDDQFTQNLVDKQNEIDQKLKDYVSSQYEKLWEQKENGKDSLDVSPVKIIAKKIRNSVISILKLRSLRNKIGLSRSGVNPVFFIVLKEAKERVSVWGGELYFVYLPEWTRYVHGKVYQENHLKKQRRVVLEGIKELEIPIIDVNEIFAQHDDVLSLFPFRMSGHYTPEGYRLISEKIAERIMTN